jgi:alkanesulfonate monooxygenase SsuD/methylene tetrahydromethanopterin reductase-like flavin-dependent oxidoreductase (luciferase family)
MPVSSPKPRIMIGGSGERKTLRLVAQYADACNIMGTKELAHKIDVLRRHCDDVGRDVNEIEITTMHRQTSPTVDELVRDAEELAALGVSTVMTSPIGDDPARHLEETFGPAMDRLQAVEAARL